VSCNASIELLDLLTVAVALQRLHCSGGDPVTDSVCNYDGAGNDNCNNNQCLFWVPGKRQVT
jgi:hypothetical protein